MSSLRASARARRARRRARRATRRATTATRRRRSPRADATRASDATGERRRRDRTRGASRIYANAGDDVRGGGGGGGAGAREASGIDVDAVDEAAREAGEAARSGGTTGGGGGDGRREGGREKVVDDAERIRGDGDRCGEGGVSVGDDGSGDAAAERRKAAGYDEAMFEPYDGTTAVATTAAPKPSAFGKLWGGVKSKLGIASAFDKLEGLKKTAPYAKGAELAEDMRERWETSDSPVVHRIQDFQDQPVQRDRARRGVSHDSSARSDV